MSKWQKARTRPGAEIRRRIARYSSICLGAWLTFAPIAFGQSRSREEVALAKAPIAASLTVVGAPRSALVWRKCENIDVVDAGLRAFRDRQGQVVGIASEYRTRIMTGPSLLEMSKHCAVSLDSAANPDPAVHNDWTWILATWTPDGVNVLGIGHNEYHGENHAGRCLGKTPRECRYGTLVFLESHDGGRHFTRSATRPLAAVPVRQAGDFGKDIGFFSPSNIFHSGSAEYVFVRTSGGGAQPAATCLFRSSEPLNPDSWQMYDGKGFRTQRFDPYRDDTATYIPCAQIPRLNGMVWSVLTHEASGRLIALLTVIDPVTRQNRLAISTSQDPLHWTHPVMIAADFFGGKATCDKEGIYWYPSLIDPNSKARNFDTTGDNPVLFVANLHISKCRITMSRDLYYIDTILNISN